VESASRDAIDDDIVENPLIPRVSESHDPVKGLAFVSIGMHGVHIGFTREFGMEGKAHQASLSVRGDFNLGIWLTQEFSVFDQSDPAWPLAYQRSIASKEYQRPRYLEVFYPYLHSHSDSVSDESVLYLLRRLTHHWTGDGRAAKEKKKYRTGNGKDFHSFSLLLVSDQSNGL
jgi:hypothetical protein